MVFTTAGLPAALVVGACAGAGGAVVEPAAATPGAAGLDAGAPTADTAPEALAPPDAGAAPLPPREPPPVVVLDLLDHLQHATALVAGGHLCDLGAAGEHLCTRGGRGTAWAPASDADGATVARPTSRRFRVHLAAADAAASTFVIRIRPERAREIEIRTAAGRLAVADLEAGAWNVARAAVPAAHLRRGDNAFDLILRGGGDAGARALVDWVWLAPGAAPDAEPRWPAAAGAADATVVALPADAGLSFPLHVPPRARLALRAAGGDRPSTVRVRLVTDDSPAPIPLAERRLGPRETTDLAAPLSDLAGRVGRLDIVADGGDVVLATASVLADAATRDDDAVDGDASPAPAPAPRPATNLVVILIDTLRADHLSTYAPGTRVRSPFFERFAAAGVVLEAASAQENWTKPSVATLLTGLYPSSHNTQTGEAVLPPSVDTLAEILADRGFATAAFIANGYVSNRFGFHQGWQDYRNYVRERRRNRADVVVDDAIAWLDRRPQGQPFFLYVHTVDPHVPYCPPRPFLDMYDPGPYDGPIVARDTAQLLGDIKVGRLVPTPRDLVRLEALYDGEITYHDGHFGRLLDALAARGLLEDTLVWVTSDHGEEFFDHGSVGHGHSLFQELLHVPLVVSLPGTLPAGARVPTPVGLVDVLPTSLDLLGLDPHGAAQGRSIAPLLRGGAPAGYHAVYSEFLDSGRAVRYGDLKLVWQGQDVRLFDLAADPGEHRDEAETRPIATRALLDLLSVYLGRVEGPTASRAPRPVHERREIAIDPETLEQLRAMGYMLD